MTIRRNTSRRPSLFLMLGAVAFTAGTLFGMRGEIKDAIWEMQRTDVPEALTKAQFEQRLAGIRTSETDLKTGDAVPENDNPNPPLQVVEEKDEDVEEDAEVAVFEKPKLPAPLLNLDVPFAEQAPHGTWDHRDDEACEEASMVMVKAYLDGETYLSKDEVHERLNEIVAYEMERIGFFESTDVWETARVMREFYGMEDVEVIEISSMSEVRDLISLGNPVIIPAYGKALGNPFFSGEGPEYHMLVAKGYTEDQIITNDPGTRRGEDYVYDDDVLWNALHDWNGGNVQEGVKAVIVAQ